MEATLRIAGRELRVRSSLKTLLDYKSAFGTELFDDIEKIRNAKEGSLGNLSEVVTTCLRAVYVLHRPYAEEKTFAEFLEGFEFDAFQTAEAVEELAGVYRLLFPGGRPEKGPAGRD